MSDGMQRVGLEFTTKGEAEFKKSMKEVTAAINENKSAYKLAQSEWDKSTSSTEKLRDKQEYLEKQTKSYTDKVKILKDQLEKLEKGESANTEKLEKKQKALDSAKTKLESYKEKTEKLKSEIVELSNKEGDNSQAILKKTKQLQSAEENVKKYEEKCKNAQQQLEAMEQSEGRNEEAIAKKKAELNVAQAVLNNYESSLKEVNESLKNGSAAAEEYAEKIKKAGEKISSAGEKMTKTVTTAVAGIGTASAAAWNTVDKAFDNIARGTGATGEALEELKQSFENVYGNFPDSAENVSTAIADINTRFGFTGDALEECSSKFLKFANVNNVDVSTAIADVSRYMGDASIDASEYAGVLDALTSASQASGISIEKLTESLTKYGAPMRALGFETQESIAIFSQWEKAGVNTEIAFSGMKTAISNWSAAGLDAREEFKKTLNEIAECPDIASATTLAIETFGKKAGPDLADAIQGGRFSIEEFMSVIENSAGSLEGTWDAVYSETDKAKEALNSLTVAGAELGDTALQALAPIISDVVESIKEFTEWFKNLDDSQKETIITIAAVVAAIGPLLIFIGKITTGVGGIISAIGKIGPAISAVKTALTAMQTFMLANPATIWITAIMAVIAAIALLWNKCEWFREGCIEIWNGIKEAFSNAGEEISQTIDEIASFITSLPKKVTEGIDKFKEEVTTGFTEGVENAKQGVISGFTDCYNKIDELTDGRLSGLVSLAAENLSDMKAAYDEAGGGIQGIMAAALTGVKDSFSNGFEAIDVLTDGKLGRLIKSVARNMEEVKNKASMYIDKIKSIFDFDWHFPKLKMPHFSASGEFSLNPLKVPSFDVSWYANGGILNSPTIFGQADNKLLGGGEAGKEIVSPLSDLKQYLQEVNTRTNAELLKEMKEMFGDVMYSAFVRALKTVNPQIVLDDEKVGDFIIEVLRKEVFT